MLRTFGGGGSDGNREAENTNSKRDALVLGALETSNLRMATTTVESATACVIQLDYYHRAHMCLALAKSLTAANLINANRVRSFSPLH
jgi:hypothetical protein